MKGFILKKYILDNWYYIIQIIGQCTIKYNSSAKKNNYLILVYFF
jgi:hypothetical protein